MLVRPSLARPLPRLTLALIGLSLLAAPLPAAAQVASSTRVNEGNGDGMDTHLFRPAIDSKGFLSVNGSDILGHTNLSFGLVLDYGRGIMRTRNDAVPLDGAMEPCENQNCQILPGSDGSGLPSLVQNSFQGTFGFNYGLFNRAVVGVTLPFVLMAGDEAYQIGENGAIYNSSTLDRQTVSFIALHGKYRFTRVDRGPGLALVVQAGIPFGDIAKDLGADPGFWFWPQAVLEQRFGSTQWFKVGLNVGYRLHTGENPRFQNALNGEPQLEEGELEYGNQATFGLGLSLRALDALDIIAETYGTFITGGDSDGKQKFSQEILGGIKLFIEKNSYLMLGGGGRAWSTGYAAANLRLVLGFVFEPSIGDRDGDGYKDDVDKCPDEPEDFDGFEDEDGCPDPDNDKDGILDIDDRCPDIPEDRDGDQDDDGCPEGKKEGDRDGDGIPDSKDKCPDDPEDKDGFEDLDGCPELDNDKDGIPDSADQCPEDAEDVDKFEDQDGCPDPDNDKDQIPDVKDKCPNDPETYNGFQDQDGCPDKGKVIVEGNEIVILEKVQFETNSAKILPQSHELLDAVAATLKAHTEFLTVEVAGHADERASDEHNLRLTKARAASVMEALRQRGIANSRLVSQGYGEYCPADSASNPEAWERNRRVEFKVVKTEDGITDVQRGCAAAKDKGVTPPVVR
jgi:outer membrane protein OmpA-like peptidoglycan-associated protein